MVQLNFDFSIRKSCIFVLVALQVGGVLGAAAPNPNLADSNQAVAAAAGDSEDVVTTVDIRRGQNPTRTWFETVTTTISRNNRDRDRDSDKNRPTQTEITIPTEFHPDYDPEFNTRKVYKGEGTHYDPGVGAGACGKLNYGNQMVVAMNTFQYGATPNPNQAPICGKCVQLTYSPDGGKTKKTAKATVVDRCPVCKFGDVDMSERVFQRLAPLGKGRIPITWSFTKC